MLQGALLKHLSIVLTVLLVVFEHRVYLPATILKLHLEERENWKGKAKDVFVHQTKLGQKEANSFCVLSLLQVV